jgi:hypothetical protein
LFTRNGHDWSGRFPLIAEAALRNRNSSFVIDGEAVLLGVDGISDFNGLHCRKHDDEVMFYAFDILVSDGEDLRKLPLHLRKNNLARLLAKRINGIFLADFEQGEIGPDLFRHACLMGLEGLVSKHKDRPYRAGRSPHWVHDIRKCRKGAILKAGSIEFSGLAIACLIRNESETGAALEVISASDLPAKFTLLVASARTRHSCTIIWRTGKMIGVKFL